MKFRGVLVKRMDDQRDRDHTLVDPAGVQFDDDEVYPIFQDFSYNMPPAGFGKLHREEDGSIVVEGELSAMFAEPHQLAMSAMTEGHDFSTDRLMHVITRARLMSIHLTDHHPDETQPSIVVF